ncbi:Tar ligand binding domain-containing protein (plasmid) [Kosakonia cowanii]|uniref:methyl-accepting chemotaxis protein n=1 Tax=Kosakonia cowanii TaxID=208223 RepID=UPI001E2CF995|nr:methyl-accepting chemotaxis protein [Kosakonia cowanii]UGS48541.1 Tar ligand binding domain-containing protein [Kosakonia cowanii]
MAHTEKELYVVISKIKIKTGLSIILGMLSLFLIALSVISLVSLAQSKESIKKVDRIEGDQIIPLHEIFSDLLSARIIAQKISTILANNQGEDVSYLLEKERAYISSAVSGMNELRQVIPLTPEGINLRKEIDLSFNAYMEKAIYPMQHSLEMRDLNSYRNVLKNDMSEYSEKFQKNMNDFTSFARGLGDKEVYDSVINYRHSSIIILSVFVFSVIVIIISVLIIRGNIFRPIEIAKHYFSLIESGDLSKDIPHYNKTEMGELINSLANMQSGLIRIVAAIRDSSFSISDQAEQLSAGNQDLASRTEQQSASIVETAASMEQLTSSVGHNSVNTRNAADMTRTMYEIAEKNNNNIASIIKRIDSIEESSDEISSILDVIDGIAFQTNILALNAAVEAARAGDAGKGFAVVAAEVRTLAQRSASAAKEIQDVIENSKEKISQGAELAHRSGNDMESLMKEVITVRDVINEISLASEEQSQGISQVNIAVSQLESVAQQNASLVEQSAAATDTVSLHVRSLQQTLKTFRLS